MRLCEAGKYCPDANGSAIMCPKGYYCPMRTVAPVECRYGESDCPEGSTLPAAPPSSVLGVFIIFNLALLVGARFAYAKWSDWDLEKKKERETELQNRKTHLRLVFGIIKGQANLGDRMFEGLRPVSKPISLGFKDLSLTLKSGKSVLRTCTVPARTHGGGDGTVGRCKSTFSTPSPVARLTASSKAVTVNGERPPGHAREIPTVVV